MVPLVLSLLALLLAFLILHDVFFPAAPAITAVNTVAVTTGNVQSAVSGTGTVVPAQQANVGFGESGTLAEVDVTVGQSVTKGQVLARLDTTLLQQALQQAQNGLAQAQATLNGTVNGNAVQQAQHGLTNAQQSLSDTQAQVNLTAQQDAQAVAAAQQKLTTDQGTPCPSPSPGGGGGNASNCNNPTVIAADQSAISSAQNKQTSDQLSGQHQVNQANNAITSAQDALNNATLSKQDGLTSQQAALSNAQLQVQTAQRNVDQATLTAPFDGVIQSISGVVGEAVSQGGGATSQSPGSQAPQPSSSGATSGGAGGGTGGTGGGAFIVLSNVAGMQVIAPFAEADASRLAQNQQASVTFDAVTGLTLPAHVLAVASQSTVISNVTNYYATLILDQLDPRLKSGMTANASVVVQSATNVLTLPNSVITHIGNAAFVTLLGADGKTQTRQQIQTGAVGDTTTQVTGGLNSGDKVVRPSLRSTTGTTGLGAGGAGRGGLGGGGAGGGGAIRIGGGG